MQCSKRRKTARILGTFQVNEIDGRSEIYDKDTLFVRFYILPADQPLQWVNAACRVRRSRNVGFYVADENGFHLMKRLAAEGLHHKSWTSLVSLALGTLGKGPIEEEPTLLFFRGCNLIFGYYSISGITGGLSPNYLRRELSADPKQIFKRIVRAIF